MPERCKKCRKGDTSQINVFPAIFVITFSAAFHLFPRWLSVFSGILLLIPSYSLSTRLRQIRFIPIAPNRPPSGRGLLCVESENRKGDKQTTCPGHRYIPSSNEFPADGLLLMAGLLRLWASAAEHAVPVVPWRRALPEKAFLGIASWVSA